MPSHNCEDHYINANDATGNKVCIVCLLRARQEAVSVTLDAPQIGLLSEPILRETMTINMGSMGQFEVFKDEMMKQIYSVFELKHSDMR